MPIAASHPFIQSLEHLIGFTLVLLALGMLWALTVLVGQFFKNSGRVAAAPAIDVPPVLSEGEPSEEEVVAIAASVATLLGRRSRVVSIRSAAKDWSREGRREQFASHKIR